MRLRIFQQMTFALTFGMLSISVCCRADALFDAILQAACDAAQQVVTGRVDLGHESYVPKISLEQVQRLRKNSVEKQEVEQIFKEEKTVTFQERLIFDNRANRARSEERFHPTSVNIMNNKAVYDPKFVKYYNKFSSLGSKRGGAFITVQKPGPVGGSLEIWRGRLLVLRALSVQQKRTIGTLLRYDPVSGQAVLAFRSANPRKKNTMLYTVETHNHYFLSRVQGLNARNFMEYSIEAVPREMAGGLVYPQKLVEQAYYETVGRTPVLYSRNTTQALSVTLNVPIDPKELDFGDYPRDARVQDNRFNPPLAYHQGRKQLTDAELFAASKDPEYFVRIDLADYTAEHPRHRPFPSFSAEAYVLVGLEVTGAVALLFLVGLGGRHLLHTAKRNGR